ncbi:MAG: phage minor capsid protein [Anaeroplasma bactoclasticum]|nr:phage minor capsid protein [Anaeroplasma bactoclasticum]
MAKKKQDHKHIAEKDKGDNVAKILGDMMQETSNRLLSTTFDRLLVNSGQGEKAWYQSQISSLNAFKLQVDKMAEEEKKRLLKANKQGLKELNLTQKQNTKISKEINKGINDLKKSVISSYVNNVASINASAKVLKSNVAESLYKNIRDKIEQTQNYGIVAYKNGRGVRWENYMEMKVRTDIQNDITKNMIKAGAEAGNVFFIAAYFGDCAKDHVEAQGKIYVDENWETNAPKARLEEIANYISAKNIKTVQEISEGEPYLTTRPNCRHFFQMISIDEVLGIKNEKDLNSKREEFDLNFNGKYKPDKYKALTEQRYNERNIRHWKGKLEADQKLLDKMPSTIPERERLLLSSRITLDKRKIRDWQLKQRQLIKANSEFLERDYSREVYNKMHSDFGIKEELKKKGENINTIEMENIPREETRNLELETSLEESIGKINVAPKMLIERFNLNKNCKIYFRESTQSRQGSAEHIIADHSKEINNNYINTMIKTIKNPIDLVEGKCDRVILVQHFMKDSKNREVYFYVVLEKNKDDNFEIITAYPTKKYKKIK